MGLCVSSGTLSRDDMKGKYGEMYGDYLDKEEMFQITMCEAPCEETGCYCASLLCGCPALVRMRYKALNHINPGSGWDDYKCCQGYGYGCNFGESSCPVPCVLLEACLCPGCAVSATSFLIRERYNLGIDAGDESLIQCNNCLFTISVVVQCIGIFFDWDGEQECVSFINCLSEVVFCCVSACMTAQVNREIEYREKMNAPASMEMTR